jgi:HSP20 family molecular chaperone IbpA
MSVDVIQATPPVNIYESNGELSVALPIPGTHPNHVDVVVEPQRLRVEASSKYPQARQNYLKREWHVGTWRLDVPLPRRVDPARSRATLHLGVLVVMAPVSANGGNGAEHRPRVESDET